MERVGKAGPQGAQDAGPQGAQDAGSQEATGCRVTGGHGMQDHLVKRESGDVRRGVETREGPCDRQATASTGR